MDQTFAILSVVLSLAAVPPYYIAILHGETKPERATWVIFSVLNLTALVSQVYLGATWSLAFLGADTLNSLGVLALAVKFGVGGWTRLDRLALAVATVGVIISILARQPVIALLGAVLADFSGTSLTIRKAFRAPGSEALISWLLSGSSALCGLLSVGKWDAALLLYPAYLVFANYAIPVAQWVGSVYWRSHVQPKEVI